MQNHTFSASLFLYRCVCLLYVYYPSKSRLLVDSIALSTFRIACCMDVVTKVSPSLLTAGTFHTRKQTRDTREQVTTEKHFLILKCFIKCKFHTLTTQQRTLNSQDSRIAKISSLKSCKFMLKNLPSKIALSRL